MPERLRLERDWVLVVDDDAAMRILLSDLFQRVGYDVEEAEDGDSALDIIRERRPSLVVVYVLLPGISGYEVCRQAKDAFGTDLPVIIISGERVEPLDRVAGILLGADDYLVKPFDLGELLVRARRLIDQDRQRRADADMERTGDLTKREAEVLWLLSEGLTQKEIGMRLAISAKTVGSHIQSVLSKLDVHSRAAAVALAHRAGLIGELRLTTSAAEQVSRASRNH